jgi:GT2 family glycosyltransferase
MNEADRITIVVLTHNRPAELARTLDKLTALPEAPAVIVVDNGSVSGVVAKVMTKHPGVTLVRSDANLGAAGRNLGVAQVRTPYVAFCDDDTWWAPSSLARACALLDACPSLGVVNARVLVGPDEREDATCQRMARSPLQKEADLPGTPLIAFMAGAVVMRTQAYRDAGGYEPRFFLGGEESLMGLDMATNGWHMVYAPDVVTHHEPSPARVVRHRQILMARNRIWTAWLRLPWRDALRQTALVWREVKRQHLRWPVFVEAMMGWPWVRAHRRVAPLHVARMHKLVFGDRAQH